MTPNEIYNKLVVEDTMLKQASYCHFLKAVLAIEIL